MTLAIVQEAPRMTAKDKEIIRLKREVHGWKVARNKAVNRSLHWQHETEYLRRHLLQMRDKIDTLLKTYHQEDDL